MFKNLYSWRFWEHSFTVIALFLYSGGLLRLVLSGGANQRDNANYDASLILLVFAIIYAITAVLLVLRWKKVLAFVRCDRWIVPLLVLTMVSYFWSDFPSITLRRSIALVGTSLFGLYLASRYTIRQQLILLGWASGISVFLSLLFVVALPQYGISGGMLAGAWRGIYAHKNGLGARMAFSTVVFLMLGLSHRRYRYRLLALSGLAFMLIIPARSTTALAIAVSLVVALGFYQVLNWRAMLAMPSVLGILLICLLVGMAIVANSEVILTSLGEDVTLTGRTGFWPLIIDKIAERPWLGYGHEGFWRGTRSEAYDIYLAGVEGISHAHNGILQLGLNLGLVGVVLFLFGYWNTLLHSLKWARVSKTIDSYWPLMVLTFLIPANVAESSLMGHNDIDWVLYVTAAFSVLATPERHQISEVDFPNEVTRNSALPSSVS